MHWNLFLQVWNKVISDSKIAVSREEEIVEKLASYWDLLDLNLEEILGIKEDEKMGASLGLGDTVGGV